MVVYDFIGIRTFLYFFDGLLVPKIKLYGPTLAPFFFSRLMSFNLALPQ